LAWLDLHKRSGTKTFFVVHSCSRTYYLQKLVSKRPGKNNPINAKQFYTISKNTLEIHIFLQVRGTVFVVKLQPANAKGQKSPSHHHFNLTKNLTASFQTFAQDTNFFFSSVYAPGKIQPHSLTTQKICFIFVK
jgi:hypothetical protein